MFGYIYITTNSVNGKKYIGQKKSDKFLGESYLGSGKILRKAINKYGIENFKVELIEEVIGDKNSLNEREMFWISYYNAVESDMFYNIHPDGSGGATYGHLGHKVSDENKAFYKEFHSNRFKNNPDLCKAASERNKKRFSNPVEREKISKAVKELWSNENYRRHMSDAHKGQISPMKGKHHSLETREKISNKCKGKPSPMKGVKLSEEQKERHSALMKGRHFWTNGIKDVLRVECPGGGWVRGRSFKNNTPRDPNTGKFIKKGGEKHDEEI